MIGPDYIRQLPACEEGCEEGGIPCQTREALVYLAEHATGYSSGLQTQPLERMAKPEKTKSFITCTIRIRRKSRLSIASAIGRIDWTSGTEVHSISDGQTAPEYSERISSEILNRKHAGYLVITSGRDRCVLDLLLEELGPHLLDLGYTLQPCISGSKISFIIVRKDHRQWTWCYAETATGVPVDTLLSFARDAGESDERSERTGSPRALHTALGVYQAWLSGTFGAVIHPTVGMTALSCVRMGMPTSFHKWRPTPLLVAMERIGRGYRGGMTFAVRYRGPSWRIDVNRQYTHALRSPLPYRAAFGRYGESPDGNGPGPTDGVFVCNVRLRDSIPYPLGVWDGTGFSSRVCGPGAYVSILHTTEFEGLEAIGATVVPYYGYIYTHTFTLGEYVERLQSICREHGRDSAIGKLTKPLGNYVYGKFGQNPRRKELLFSKERPESESWFPYMDDTLRVWPMIWERSVDVVTSSQHVDIAGTITGAARSQTLRMWAFLSSRGVAVARCHTDSLTVTSDPMSLLNLSMDDIGQWHAECADVETVIIGANAYIDQDGAHIAGVSDPTWQMVERLYDSRVAYVVQQQNAPLRGFSRAQTEVRRKYGG